MVQRDEAKGEETRGVAAANAAAECAGKSPPPEPGTGSRDGRYGGGGNRTRVRGRTGPNVYKRSPRFSFDRRPEADTLPTV